MPPSPTLTTLVVGVSPGADRYANLACRQLRSHGHRVVAIGLRPGQSDGVPIQTGTPAFADVDTITLYLNPTRQVPLIDYFLSLRPRRVIFNPGTENNAFVARAEAAGIEAVVGCTLVMLGAGTY